VFEDLKNVLYMDDAVAGEAAGIGMGLLCCGSGSDKTQEMLAYAHDTQVGVGMGCWHVLLLPAVMLLVGFLLIDRQEPALSTHQHM
jgi:26S proteasome regulatory subunit N2